MGSACLSQACGGDELCTVCRTACNTPSGRLTTGNTSQETRTRVPQGRALARAAGSEASPRTSKRARPAPRSGALSLPEAVHVQAQAWALPEGKSLPVVSESVCPCQAPRGNRDRPRGHLSGSGHTAISLLSNTFMAILATNRYLHGPAPSGTLCEIPQTLTQ